jgi:hypothetical protein
MEARKRSPRTNIYSLEVGGTLIILAVILAYLLLRHWHQIPWSAR